jgi:glycosyltransferase involved in cell wall biosynthesis
MNLKWRKNKSKKTRILNLFQKTKAVIGRQNFMQSRESWSFFRLFVFFFSPKGIKKILRFGSKVIRYVFRKIFGGPNDEEVLYNKWCNINMPNQKDLDAFAIESEQFVFKPTFSIIIPTYKPNILFIKQAIDSVINQVYTNWEICITDDHSENKELLLYLKEISSNPKIKVNFHKKNGHISAASNSAIADATGEFICLLDHDDLITPDALFQFAKKLNEDSSIDIMYSDEDKINNKNWFVQPAFKPQWSPDNFLSRNYIGHFVCLRTELVKKVNGFRIGFEGSQDYDLLLRITELTNKIVRIPKILYHWRMHDGSTASNEGAKDYAFKTGEKALNEALSRRGINAKAKLQKGKPGIYSIDYKLNGNPKISIIIPTKNNASVLETCLKSVFEMSSYSNFEVILIDNNSDEDSLFELLDKYKQQEPERFKVLTLSYAFNYAQLMNDGAKASTGEYILLLNNDTEVLNPDWLEKMLSHSQRKEIGAVGAKLLYPNDTIQHAGVVIGIGGVAGHTFISAEKDEPGYLFYLTCVNNYSAVTAACLMVSKSKFFEIGGFDENLAVEYNDVDFCLKLIEAGYYNIYNPEVVLYHYESLTRGHPHANRESYKRHIKEIKYFMSKWQKFIDDDPCYNPNLTLTTTHFAPRMDDPIIL